MPGGALCRSNWHYFRVVFWFLKRFIPSLFWGWFSRSMMFFLSKTNFSFSWVIFLDAYLVFLLLPARKFHVCFPPNFKNVHCCVLSCLRVLLMLRKFRNRNLFLPYNTRKIFYRSCFCPPNLRAPLLVLVGFRSAFFPTSLSAFGLWAQAPPPKPTTPLVAGTSSGHLSCLGTEWLWSRRCQHTSGFYSWRSCWCPGRCFCRNQAPESTGSCFQVLPPPPLPLKGTAYVLCDPPKFLIRGHL